MGVGREFERTLGTVLVCLAPMAPMFASELWAGFAAAPPLARLAALDPHLQAAQSPSPSESPLPETPFDLVRALVLLLQCSCSCHASVL